MTQNANFEKYHSTIIDNSTDYFKLKTVLNNYLLEAEEFWIATGYWQIDAFKEIHENLKQFLERGGKIRLLMGQTPEIRHDEKYGNCPWKTKADEVKSYPKDYIKYELDELADRLTEPLLQSLLLLKKYISEYAIDENGEFLQDEDGNYIIEKEGQIELRIHDIEKDGVFLRYQKQQERDFLHAKCYILKRKGKFAISVIGSSNFTECGISKNAEINYLESASENVVKVINEYEDTSEKKLQILPAVWYEKIWNEAKPWSKVFIEILNHSRLKGHPTPKLVTPYEVYIRAAQEQFHECIDDALLKQISGYVKQCHGLSEFDYQTEGAARCYWKMIHKHGFLLSDVTGLGKTIVSLLTARLFLDREPEPSRKNILIVAPPSVLRSNWQKDVKKLGLEDYVDLISCYKLGDLIPNDDISSEIADNPVDDNTEDLDDVDPVDIIQTFNPSTDIGIDEPDTSKKYGLIIIDESHNFRNKNNMYKKLEEVIQNIESDGQAPYIGLISATPQNNRPEDLLHQLLLIDRNQNGRSIFTKIPERALTKYFNTKTSEYREIIKSQDTLDSMNILSDEDRKQRLNALARDIREKVLNDIMVRRTRTDVSDTSRYKNAPNFPIVEDPVELTYDLDSEFYALFERTKEDIETRLNYYRYSATDFLKDKSPYTKNNLNTEMSGKNLAGTNRTTLFKRFESSVDAFYEMICNFRMYNENMITMYHNDCIYICPDKKELVNNAFKNHPNDFEAICAEIEKGLSNLSPDLRNSNRKYKRDDFTEKDGKSYLECLLEDKYIYDNLIAAWDRIIQWDSDRDDRIILNDPKSARFVDALNHEIFKYAGQKIVIFSESIATVKKLEKLIATTGRKSLTVHGQNRDPLAVELNFDANTEKTFKDYPIDPEKMNCDILITSDVSAEGVNLHRADTIINYDTPWNPARLIQRIGRINRIGTKYDKVYIYNFMPSHEGNRVTRLFDYAHTKIQAFHSMFGSDNAVLTKGEDIHKALNGEPSAETPHIKRLMEYKKKHPERYDELFGMKEVSAFLDNDTEYRDFHALTAIGSPFADCYMRISDQDINVPSEVLSNTSFLDACLEGIDETSSPRHSKDNPLLQSIENKFKSTALQIYNYDSERNQKNARIKEAKEYIESIWNCLNEESKQILAEAEELLNHGNQTICTVILRIKNQFSQGSLIDINNDIQKRLTPLIHTNSADETLNNTYITLFRGGNEHV